MIGDRLILVAQPLQRSNLCASHRQRRWLANLSQPEKLAQTPVRRGRPTITTPKVSTTIRLSQEVLDHFKAAGRGWQTRIDAALREWIENHDAA